MTDRRIAVVGFGYIGSVIGAVLAKRGHDVVGIEPNERIAEAVNSGATPFNEPQLDDYIKEAVANGSLRVHSDMVDISDRDTVLITVGTPLDRNNKADMSQIKMACEAVAPYLSDGQLVMIKSTVPPGTTAEVVAPILRQKADVSLAFSPERLAEGKAIKELEAFPVVVGGIDEESKNAAATFWKNTLGLDVIAVQNAETAEMVKLADNLWIDLNIALAGELAKVCDQIGGIDVLEVIDAANSLPKGNYNVNILVPSVGVGGYCLTKDPWFVYQMGQGFGIELQIPRASRTINDSMPAYSADLIEKSLLPGSQKTPQSMTIAVLGVAFKNNTGDCRFTPTKGVIEALSTKGFKLKIYDPWVSNDDAKTVTDISFENSIDDAIHNADCIAFLAGHDDFRNLTAERIAKLANAGALVFDGRMFFSTEQIRAMQSLGLKYKGVGR